MLSRAKIKFDEDATAAELMKLFKDSRLKLEKVFDKSLLKDAVEALKDAVKEEKEAESEEDEEYESL